MKADSHAWPQEREARTEQLAQRDAELAAAAAEKQVLQQQLRELQDSMAKVRFSMC